MLQSKLHITLLPSIEDFKQMGKRLNEEDHTITSHSKALNILALRYGYKNWQAIKPVLKSKKVFNTLDEMIEDYEKELSEESEVKTIFPLTKEVFKKNLAIYIGREGLDKDFFAINMHIYYDLIADIYFSHYKEIANERELDNLRLLLDLKNIIAILMFHKERGIENESIQGLRREILLIGSEFMLARMLDNTIRCYDSPDLVLSCIHSTWVTPEKQKEYYSCHEQVVYFQKNAYSFFQLLRYDEILNPTRIDTSA